MKKNNGITLISLVVTIVILLLISTVTINVGMDSYNLIAVENFTSKLKIIQAKVDNIAEENEDINNYGFTKLSDISGTDQQTYNLFYDIITNPTNYNINTDESWDDESDGNIENYYYFTQDDLEKIGLKNQEISVIINFETRNVIAKKGVKKDDKTYYRQYDLSGGDKLINE